MMLLLLLEEDRIDYDVDLDFHGVNVRGDCDR